MKSQTDKVLAHLEYIGAITPIVALNAYGCMRLAARISDLKKKGYSINKTMKISTRPDGSVCRYAVYFLEVENYY